MLKLILSLTICVEIAGCASETATDSSVAATGPQKAAPTVSVGTVPTASAKDAAIEKKVETDELALQPRQIVDDYFGLLRQGRGPEAIRKHWNVERHAQRLYRADFEQLTDNEKAQVVTEQERFLMGIYANPATAGMMKQVEVANVSESRDGDSCIVRFDASLGAGTQSKPQQLLFAKQDSRWRIIDMTASVGEYMTEVIHRIYKETGGTPLQYATGMTSSLPAINEMIDRSENRRLHKTQQ